MRDGLVVRGVYNCHKIITAKHGVLRDDLAAELRNLIVHCVESLGILVQSLAALGSQRTEQDVGRHDFYLLSSKVSPEQELPARPVLDQVRSIRPTLGAQILRSASEL